MQKEVQKIFFDFEIIAFEFTKREYMSPCVNTLTNSLKISDTTKTEFFERNFIVSQYVKKQTQDFR